MKNVYFILWKKTKQSFWPTQWYALEVRTLGHFLRPLVGAEIKHLLRSPQDLKNSVHHAGKAEAKLSIMLWLQTCLLSP